MTQANDTILMDQRLTHTFRSLRSSLLFEPVFDDILRTHQMVASFQPDIICVAHLRIQSQLSEIL